MDMISAQFRMRSDGQFTLDSPGNSQNCLYGDVIKMASLLQAAGVPLLWALSVSESILCVRLVFSHRSCFSGFSRTRFVMVDYYSSNK